MPDHKSILSPLSSIQEELTPAEEEAAAKAAAKKEAIRQENLKKSLKEIVDSEQRYGDSLEALIETLESIISSKLASPSSRNKMNKMLSSLRNMLILSREISTRISKEPAKDNMNARGTFEVIRDMFDPKKKFSSNIILDEHGDFRKELLASKDPQKNSWFGIAGYVEYPGQYEALSAELSKISEEEKKSELITIANKLLVTPIQRFMRYRILMEATMGHTLLPDASLKEALDTVKGVLISVNERKRAEEKAQELITLQKNKSWMSRGAPALLFSAKKVQSLPRISSDSPPRPPTGPSRLH